VIGLGTNAGAGDAARWEAPGFWRLNGINTFWAASQGLWNATYILLALSASLIAPSQKTLVVGRAAAAGGALAVLVPIAAGWLSDRTRTRWGRRRPWIAAGAAVNVLGLLLLAWAPSVPALIAAYLVLQLGNNAAGAAFAGIVPEVIPEERRGGASALLNSATIVGTVVCLAASLVILQLLGSTAAGAAVAYVVIAAMVAGTTLLSLQLMREPASTSIDVKLRPSPARGAGLPVALRDALAEGWNATLADHDFRWVITTRFFQTLGIWTILPFVTFYFQDVVRASNYGAASDLWQLCILAGGLVPAIVCGFLSDRTHRRKLFVYLSSGLQGMVAAVLLFTLVSDLTTVFALGILFGVGYGAYSAVDWALACDVLQDRQRAAARDMGVFHVAYTLPQVFAPALLAPVLYRLNQPGSIAGVATGPGVGYRAVFATAAVWFVLATVMVRRIRNVR
jgi:Na+/melibiose symporter-like transporter